MQNSTVEIFPYRNIPFDIGKSIDNALLTQIRDYLLQTKKAKEIAVGNLLTAISHDISAAFEIDSDLSLYIFSFGIGVFVFKDSAITEEESNYAVNYIHKRKEAHNNLLNIKYKASLAMLEIAEGIRKIARLGTKKLRASASREWGHSGFSYIMTLSAVVGEDCSMSYKDMNEKEKINLHIMLDPSIIHSEDSGCYTLFNIEKGGPELDAISLSELKEPKDWIKSPLFSVYISWSAVLLYSNEIQNELVSVMESLEVDLQSMWMYTYCMYENLKNISSSSSRPTVSQLRNLLYSFKKKFNEFKSIDDASISSNLFNIRSELIRTSGIESYAEQYIEYMEFCIAETESINAEKQRKYACLNEILLFIIAFVQIAPMLYDLMTGNFSSVQIVPIIVMAAIVVIASIIIIRKD